MFVFSGAPPQEEQVRTLRVRPADAERRAAPEWTAVPDGQVPLHPGIQVPLQKNVNGKNVVQIL